MLSTRKVIGLIDGGDVATQEFHHIQLIRRGTAIQPDGWPKASALRKLGTHFHKPILKLLGRVRAENSPGPGISRSLSRDRGHAIGHRHIRWAVTEIARRGNRLPPRASLIPLAGVDRRPIELVT